MTTTGYLHALGLIIIVWLLSRISARVHELAIWLKSIDAELFRLAQEQNPSYGICSSCERRAVVRHVVPKTGASDPLAADLFYCHACWYESPSVRLGDDEKRYRDRPNERDRLAALAGPGSGL